jgi:hypothetical protein
LFVPFFVCGVAAHGNFKPSVSRVLGSRLGGAVVEGRPIVEYPHGGGEANLCLRNCGNLIDPTGTMLELRGVEDIEQYGLR